nr:MAG TPA: hypothetical protein [Caudoviricetes sp.]
MTPVQEARPILNRGSPPTTLPHGSEERSPS